MAEGGLSPAEVGKEIAEHAKHSSDAEAGDDSRRDRVTIVEAVLLAVVAVIAAYSGFASAKWGTEASLDLAKASATRTAANRANLAAMETRNFDASTFNTWFSGYVAGNQQAMDVAVRRFRPEFRTAFDAWIATSPATNPAAPPGPTYMPQYAQPDVARSKELDTKADSYYAAGSKAGGISDDYVRITVFLASVLFLVGISGHFTMRRARYGLVTVGSVILAVAVILLILAPKPPGLP